MASKTKLEEVKMLNPEGPPTIEKLLETVMELKEDRQ